MLWAVLTGAVFKINRVLGTALLSFVFVFSLPLEAQSAPHLLSEDLQRLERDSRNSNAFRSLARLYQLSGNDEKALEAWFGAAYFNSANGNRGSPSDYEALLEAVRLLISMGEYERADTELRKVPASSGDAVYTARLLWAELIAFSRKEVWLLVQIASDPAYLPHRSEIYYVLWKTGGDNSWKEKLLAEFPHSPEARICGRGNVNAAATPQWLLATPSPSVTQAVPQAAQTSSVSTAASAPERAVFLQTGLYRSETNARSEALRLERAGFKPAIAIREVNGANLWAVLVDGGGESATRLRQLKNAGWPDAFPVVTNL